MSNLVLSKTEVTTTWLSTSDIENAKANLLMSNKVVNLLDNKADTQHEYAFRQFIEMDANRLAVTLNKMFALEEHLQVVVGQLAYKLSIKPNAAFTTFHNAMIAPIVAFNILNSLIEVNTIQSQTKAIAEICEETGKKTWRNQTFNQRRMFWC